MKPLEQAFKAADILIQNGGFGLIVIDLGEIEERLVRKIPLTTWFRFARVIEKQPTTLVVFATYPAAQSCAAVTLHIKNAEVHWSRKAGPGRQPNNKLAHNNEPVNNAVHKNGPVYNDESTCNGKPICNDKPTYNDESTCNDESICNDELTCNDEPTCSMEPTSIGQLQRARNELGDDHARTRSVRISAEPQDAGKPCITRPSQVSEEAISHTHLFSGVTCEVEVGRVRGQGRKPVQSFGVDIAAKPVWKRGITSIVK
jgi:hypothetical protein